MGICTSVTFGLSVFSGIIQVSGLSFMCLSVVGLVKGVGMPSFCFDKSDLLFDLHLWVVLATALG